jgi:hypothetical protein
MPHNLRIVDYVIGVPGSVHDSNAFSKAQIARHPQTFLGGNKWIWVDSAYGSRPWCVVPFKQPSAGGLTRDQKTFNYHLSKVRQTFLTHKSTLTFSGPHSLRTWLWFIEGTLPVPS